MTAKIDLALSCYSFTEAIASNCQILNVYNTILVYIKAQAGCLHRCAVFDLDGVFSSY